MSSLSTQSESFLEGALYCINALQKDDGENTFAGTLQEGGMLNVGLCLALEGFVFHTLVLGGKSCPLS